MAYKSLQRQGGVALIMAVVSVAIIAIIAVAMSSEQTLLIRRIQNTILVDSAWQYAIGGEQFAALALQKEQAEGKKANKDYDHSKELHLSEEFLFPLEGVGGSISGNMEELQGLFNLTNLVQADGSDNSAGTATFQNLLTQVGVPASLKDNLSAAVTDWTDPDQQELPNGAEDSYYQTLEKPYLAANQPFKSVEELRLVKGFNEKIPQPNSDEEVTVFELLEEYLVVLPTQTALNVNTASEPVLQAAYPHLNASTAADLVKKAAEDPPFTTKDDFTGHAANQQQNGQAVEWDNFLPVDVRSEYFAINLTVSLGGIDTPLYSVLRRNLDDGKVHVVRRQRGK